MTISVLISDPDSAWVNSTKSFLLLKNLQVNTAENGKDAQLLISRNKYEVSILDLDLKNHSCLEVLRFIKLKAPHVRVLLTIKNHQLLRQLDISESDLKKIGADEVLFKPITPEQILRLIEKESKLETWKDIQASTESKAEMEVTASDDEFTRIRIGDYFTGRVTIFDNYIRIGKNQYIKIIHRGESFDLSRLKRYEDSKVEYLYFKTSDRITYINYTNEILEKIIGKEISTIEKKIGYTKTVVEKYIEDIYTAGLKPGMIEEGKKICQNMYNIIQKEPDLHRIFKSYEDYDPPAFAHLFLVSFFSVITCKKLEWPSSRTIEVVALASLLHDIGLLKVPPAIRDKPLSKMTENELQIYQSHSKLGADMLAMFPSISVAVNQIVFQHHEYVNAEGFPNNLNGNKIYPLAKIVALCDGFADHLRETKVPPLEGLRVFASCRTNIHKYDPAVFKALVMGFVKEK